MGGGGGGGGAIEQCVFKGGLGLKSLMGCKTFSSPALNKTLLTYPGEMAWQLS